MGWWTDVKRGAGSVARKAGKAVGTAAGAAAGAALGAPAGPAGILVGAAAGAKAGEYAGGVVGRVTGRAIEDAPKPKASGGVTVPIIKGSTTVYADGTKLQADNYGGAKLRGSFGVASGTIGQDGIWRSASVKGAKYAPGGIVADGSQYKGTFGGKKIGAPVAGVKLATATFTGGGIKLAPRTDNAILLAPRADNAAPPTATPGPASSSAPADFTVAGDTSALAAAVDDGLIGAAKRNPGKAAAIAGGALAAALAAAKYFKIW